MARDLMAEYAAFVTKLREERAALLARVAEIDAVLPREPRGRDRCAANRGVTDAIREHLAREPTDLWSLSKALRAVGYKATSIRSVLSQLKKSGEVNAVGSSGSFVYSLATASYSNGAPAGTVTP